MRNLVKWCAALAVAVTCIDAQLASANLLLNGSFDAPGGGLPISSWTKDESKTFSGSTTDLSSLEPWAGGGPTPATVGDHGVFFKAFQGNSSTGDLATANIYQDVAGTPGAVYVLTGWAGSEPNYSGNIPNTVTKSLFVLEFDNDGDRSSVLSSVVYDLKANGLGIGPPDFGYSQHSLSGTAPAGTTVVRAVVSMIDGYSNPAGGGQAFVVDDLSLTVRAIPEPTTFAMAGLAMVGAGLYLRRRNG